MHMARSKIELQVYYKILLGIEQNFSMSSSVALSNAGVGDLDCRRDETG